MNQHSIHTNHPQFFTYHALCISSTLCFSFIFLFAFTFFGPSFAATITYDYDALNRLQTVNYGNGYQETYDHDGTGNRTSLIVADAVGPTGGIGPNHIIVKDGEATITGTASDLGSGVESVEISLDGSLTWHTAITTDNWATWFYNWAATPGTYNISVRITDKGGNVTITPPYTITISPSPLYATFTGNGIWKWDGATWTQLTPGNPEVMAAAGSALYATFEGNGIWQYSESEWTQLTLGNPVTMLAEGSLVYATFAGNGIWQWDGTSWTQLAPENPENIITSGSLLYADFGSSGIWEWNGTSWRQLTPGDPENMVTDF